MTGVAKREAAAGCEKGGDDRRRETTTLARERGELFVELADKFFLVEAIDKAAHQGTQVGSRGSDGFAMSGNIGEEQATDAAGSATRDVVNIATTLSLFERLAVEPDIETRQFDSAGR
jgi:hypothetical protein